MPRATIQMNIRVSQEEYDLIEAFASCMGVSKASIVLSSVLRRAASWSDPAMRDAQLAYQGSARLRLPRDGE